MSRDWTPDELDAVSNAMKAAGQLSYAEFCDMLDRSVFPRCGPGSGREQDNSDKPSDICKKEKPLPDGV